MLGLSLSACSQHVIKTNVGSASLEQKAINSLNAMYEYPSYDYKGKFDKMKNVHYMILLMIFLILPYPL